MLMKLLILSDVHGNVDALRAIWKEEQDSDKIYCAGDLTDYGAFPEEVIRWMREHHAEVVCGNHDLHTIHIYEKTCWQSVGDKEFKWVHHGCGRLGEEEINYLKNLPDILCFEADGVEYVMTHQFDSEYGVIENMDQFERFWEEARGTKGKMGRARRIIFGHTHRHCIHILGDSVCWLNPGSVSYRRPDDPCKEAQYIVIDNGKMYLKGVSYDRSRSFAVAVEYLKSGNMMESELQDAMFFFGNAATSRDPLPEL